MIKEFIDQNQSRFLEELFDLLRIPSVSADPKFHQSVFDTAEKVRFFLEKLGAEHLELIPTGGFPVVYGEKIIDPTLPTILVYGHYDVQPADPYELWTSPPFEPVIKDGKIYARGACDDKGQMFMHIKAFETLLSTTGLACNVKFMIEGEEEVGSSHLGDFLVKYKDKLKADIILVSDTSIIANDCPSITTGLRGLSYVEVEVTGPNRDLHSGVYGGAVPNPINVLCEMIASLKDENNHISIPGFYADVVEISTEERNEMAKAPFDLEKYKQELGLSDILGESGFSTNERTSIRPTLDVNGIWGGYTGDGAKTVIASKAFAKISMRLVPNQHPDKITKIFSDHFKKIAPKSVSVEVRPHHGGESSVLDTKSAGYHAAVLAFEKTWDKTPIPKREGGSIPIVALFKQVLGLDTVLLGFGLDTDAIHSPNEHYGVFNYLKGIETICAFHQEFAKISKK